MASGPGQASGGEDFSSIIVAQEIAFEPTGYSRCGDCWTVCPLAGVVEYMHTEARERQERDPAEQGQLGAPQLAYMDITDTLGKGLRNHPDMGRNIARIIGWLDKSNPFFRGMGPYARDDVITWLAQCHANACDELNPVS